METLAYLHASCAYETSTSTVLDSDLCDREGASELRQNKLSNVAYLRVLSLVIGLCIAGATNSAIAATLQKGDNGAEVTALQAHLSQLGYFDGPQTGFFGALTQEALKRFQQDLGLSPDGILGPQTQAAIERKLSSTSVSSGNSPAFNVSDVQQKLRDRGYYKGAIDGIFGSATQQAVLSFQRDFGLTADGIVGSQTLAALSTGNAIGSDTNAPRPTNTSADANVAEIQRLLRDKGYYDGATDGVYGPSTRSAVINFQQDYGLKADGVVGSQTLQALRSSGRGNKTLSDTSFQSAYPPDSFITSPSNSSENSYPSNMTETGYSSEGRYIVVVPYQDDRTLTAVQQIVPDAFLADSRKGTFVQAGAFRDRTSAEQLSGKLRAQGLDARVD